MNDDLRSPDEKLMCIEIEHKIIYPRIKEIASKVTREPEFSQRLEEILFLRDQIRQIARNINVDSSREV